MQNYIMETHGWDITCSKEEFEKIKSDERFLGLLTLARFVNALRFCQKAVLDVKDDSLPSSARTRINSFLFASSILYEGFLLVEKLAKHYRDLNSLKNGFGSLLRNKSVQELKDSILKRARNKIVFHFDNDVAKESLEIFDLPNINFASAYGKYAGEMYFGLADEIAINFLLGPKENESDESLKERFSEILKDTTNIMGNFSRYADLLIADVLKDMGFQIKVK